MGIPTVPAPGASTLRDSVRIAQSASITHDDRGYANCAIESPNDTVIDPLARLNWCADEPIVHPPAMSRTVIR